MWFLLTGASSRADSSKIQCGYFRLFYTSCYQNIHNTFKWFMLNKYLVLCCKNESCIQEYASTDKSFLQLVWIIDKINFWFSYRSEEPYENQQCLSRHTENEHSKAHSNWNMTLVLESPWGNLNPTPSKSIHTHCIHMHYILLSK